MSHLPKSHTIAFFFVVPDAIFEYKFSVSVEHVEKVAPETPAKQNGPSAASRQQCVCV